MLEQLFGSKTRVNLLKLFLNNPGRPFYLREITRKLHTQLNSVRREILNLEKIGIIQCVDNIPNDRTKETVKTSKKFYLVNSDFVLYTEMKGLFLKSQLLVESNLIRDILKIANLQNFILTGIFTGSDFQEVDMLLVGIVNKNKLVHVIKKYEKEFNREIRYAILTKGEYKYRRDITDRFLYSILEAPKIVVVGKM